MKLNIDILLEALGQFTPQRRELPSEFSEIVAREIEAALSRTAFIIDEFRDAAVRVVNAAPPGMCASATGDSSNSILSCVGNNGERRCIQVSTVAGAIVFGVTFDGGLSYSVFVEDCINRSDEFLADNIQQMMSMVLLGRNVFH